MTAEPGTKVELFDKDGNKIGEGTADNNGKVTITPTVDIPAGNVTAKATKDGQTSDASAPKVATAATPAKPSTPVVDTDLTGKAGTKTPVEVTAAPGTKVELFDKDGNKIGEGTAKVDRDQNMIATSKKSGSGHLPNTGEKHSSTATLLGTVLGMVGLMGFAKRKKRED